MKSKVAFIVPGFLESPKRNIYHKISTFYQSKGFEVLILDIPWRNHLMSDYVDYFLQIYLKYQDKEIHTFGFSFGAMILFISSAKVDINTQILCSVSPYFQEDMDKILKSWAAGVGKKRMAEFSKISRKNISKKSKAKTILLIGTKEREIMLGVSKSIYKDLQTEKDLVVIRGVGHDIEAPKYLEEIKRQISLL